MEWSVLVILCLCESMQAYTMEESKGESGQRCGALRCRAEPRSSTCVRGKCVCQSPFSKGIGAFYCVHPEEDFCAVTSDPLLRDFQDRRLKLPSMFKCLLSHSTTRSCKVDGEQVILGNRRCDVKVYAWGGKLRGKTFIKGVDVRYKITDPMLGSEFINCRIFGEADHGIYNFSVGCNKDMNPDNPDAVYDDDPLNQDPNNRVLELMFDPVNNVYGFSDACGVTLVFRPVDKSNPRLLASGVSVSVDRRCASDFPSPGQSLCSSPRHGTASLETLASSLSRQTGYDVSTTVAAMFQILTGNVLQSFPGSFRAVEDYLPVLCEPTFLVQGLLRCLFLLDVHKVVTCFTKDESRYEMTVVFLTCIEVFCVRHRTNCNILKTHIQARNCRRFVPANDTILDFNCRDLEHS